MTDPQAVTAPVVATTDVPSGAPTGAERQLLTSCPLCAGRRLHYAFSTGSYRVVRCADCQLMLLNPQPADDEVAGPGRLPSACGRWEARGVGDPSSGPIDAAHLLAQLARYRGTSAGRLLLVSTGHGESRGLGAASARAGLDVTRVRLAPNTAAPAPRGGGAGGVTVVDALPDAGLPDASFDVCILAAALECARDPLALLRQAHALLKPDGVLVVAAAAGVPEEPAGRLRRMLAARGEPSPFRPHRFTYFDASTVQTALHLGGFDRAVVEPATGGGGAVVAFSRAGAARTARRTLSVVIPAFNEATTVASVLDAVLAKQLNGVDMEVIVVESNSTDGTRDVVQRYADHPRVRLVLEDRPRGKGHAVRTGLAHATGDFILIQDADLEYDLEDYDVLLDPLVSGREALVLGARHGGNAWWKMRQFNEQRGLSLFFNVGHWVFTTLLNVLFGQRLRDPFTMFKVFRRDCLSGLELRCNRFDFDHELLVRLIQKGYRPVEIPVNYRSRSFKEGKKVSTFRDPLTWLWTLGRLRVDAKLDLMGAVERARAAGSAPEVATTPPSITLPAVESARRAEAA